MTTWQTLTSLNCSSPVIALASDGRSLWAGGIGGIARYNGQTWEISPGKLPLSSVSTLCAYGGMLLAGGPEGIALSADAGQTWRPALLDTPMPISAIAVAPRAERPPALLAGTLNGGVLGSFDGGETWSPTNDGLEDMEVLALAWRANDRVLAGTTGGIYISPYGGRGWELCNGSVGKVVTDIVYIPGSTSALAALETGGLLHSTGSGRTWQILKTTGLPAGIEINALAPAPDGSLLLGTGTAGTFRSTDGGITWTAIDTVGALVFHAGETVLYAGLSDGVAVYDEGQLRRLPAPPLYDLRALLFSRGRMYLGGLHSGLWEASNNSWKHIAVPTEILTAAAVAPTGAFLLAGSNGMFRSDDGGETWKAVYPAGQPHMDMITFRHGPFPVGPGAAASTDGTRLLITADDGQTWQDVKSPFDGQLLVALNYSAGTLAAATYLPQEMKAQLWSSPDGGLTWRQGMEAATNWGIINIAESPGLVTLGGSMLIQQDGGGWRQAQVGPEGNGIYQVKTDSKHIFALTTAGLYLSVDRGVTWRVIAGAPPATQVYTMLLVDACVYVLKTDGSVVYWQVDAQD